MNTKTTETNGKHYATVSAGDRIVYRTPGYYTAGMALADAQCWAAFHGGNMDKVTVDLNEVYTARGAGPTGLEYMAVPAERVARAVAEAYRFNLCVEVRTGTRGNAYIQISNGKGSGYGAYHIGAEFADYALNRRWNES